MNSPSRVVSPPAACRGCSRRESSTAFRSRGISSFLLLLAALFPLIVTTTVAAQSSHERFRVEATHVATGPAIDGVLDDDAWVNAKVISEFIQQEPNEGAPATERTEVRVVYDGANLYIGVHAFADPRTIVATEMRRDSERILEEDGFQVILDTFLDRRSGYMFATNPLGARLDQQIFEEGEGSRRGTSSNINREWDGVWDVAAQRTPDGWVAEIAIPVVTLRFPGGDSQTWGINFMRNIAAKNEQAYWAPVDKGYEINRVSLAGSLVGMQSLNRGRDLKIKPFAISGGTRISNAGVHEDDFRGDGGLDVKYGVTAGLTLDLTFNTDFAQAEADDEQNNLTRFGLFYPEKRDFFLENAGQFNVGAATATQRIADLFFTRRIGITPAGEQVPIIGGARLTGKVGANNIAIMDVQTEEMGALPSENFLVARYSRDILGRSKVGGLVINRQATEGGEYNRTFAGDMTLALTPSVTINGFVARTMTPDVEDSELGGHLRAGLQDESWNLFLEYTDLQDNFNAGVGYVPRVGIRTSKAHFEYTPRPGIFGIRLMEPMTDITYTTDQQNRLVSRRWHKMTTARFNNGTYIVVWWNSNFERLDETFRVQGVDIPAGAYEFWDARVSVSSNPARRVYTTLAWSPQTFYDGDRVDYNGTLGFRVNSNLSLQGSFTRNDVDLPRGSFVSDIGAVRVDYAISPNMTLRSLTQYNSLTDQWSTSARFHYIYRPGSDFFVVYDELRRDPTGLSEYRQRNLTLKMTYLLSR